MAKIVKVTGYLVAHDDLDEDRVARAAGEILSDKFECINKSFTTQTAYLGISFFDDAWDDHPLNRIDCPVDICERYFTENRDIGRPAKQVGDAAVEDFAKTVVSEMECFAREQDGEENVGFIDMCVDIVRNEERERKRRETEKEETER